MKTNMKPGLHLVWRGMILALFLISIGPAQAGLFTDWSQRMRITFPSPLNGPLTNFPVLISFSTNMDGYAFAYSDFLAAGGGDLRFADSNESTALDYEIENWNTNGASAVWVKLPLLQSTNDYIYAYWGKSTNAAPCTTNGAVWDTNTMGVWHFSDAPSASAGDIRNSVSNSVQAKSANMEAGDQVTGLAGGALDFDGVNECVSNVLSGTALSEFTISFWERSDTTPAAQKGIFQWAQQLSSGTPFLLCIRGQTTPLSVMSLYRDAAYANIADLPNAEWIYVTLTLSPGVNPAKIYKTWVNGVPVTSYTDANGTATTQPNAAAVYFANGYNGYFDGLLDEARIANTARSTNWIYTTWLNMVSNDTFCACVNAPIGGAGIVTAAPSNVTTNMATLRGTLTHTNAGPTTVFVFWGLSDGGTNGPWDNTTQLDGYPPLGAVSTNVTLPTPDRYYYYRYAASNAAGLFWANSSVFFMADEVTVATTDGTAVPPNNTGTFTLSRPATATNEALTVTYTTSGSATNGIDFTLSASAALFSAGATNAIITLTALADGDTNSESVTLTILPGATYGLGAASNATITIYPESLVKLAGTMFSTPGIGTPGSNAFDENTNTFFEAHDAGGYVASGGYVGLDLGAGGAKRVSKVRFHPRLYIAGPSRMNGGKFQGSNDATNGVYTDLYTIPATPPTTWSEAPVSDTTAYRYLRYYGPNLGYCNIAELEFWAEATPQIATVSATDVTLTNATLNGNLTAIGSTPTTLFAYWGLTDGGTNGPWDYITQLNGEPAIGPISTNFSLPTPNRDYYYRYAASNDAGLFWATSSVSFMAAEVTVAATDAAAASLSNNTGTFTISRPAAATNTAITVTYTMSGSANNGVDYTLSGSTALPAGTSTAIITLTAWPDFDATAETAVLTILPGSAYLVGTASNATVTISPESLDDWPHRMRITFPLAPGAELTNFPVLITMSNGIDGSAFAYSNFSSAVGADLRFSDDTGTQQLDYEIESWNTNGTSHVWVKIPLLKKHSTDTILAYWGAETPPPPCTTNSAVWDTNTIGVWHFNEAPSASAGDIRNSVSNSVQASSSNMEAGDLVTGVAGGALDFDGSDEYVANTMSGTALSEFTVSFWIRPDTTPSSQKGLFQWASSLNSIGPFVLLVRGKSVPYTTMHGFVDNGYPLTTPVTDSVWTHVTVTLEPGLSPAKIYRLWINGVVASSYTDTDGLAGTQPSAATVYFANGYNGYFDGLMDEARISRIARSTDWNYATWLNIASNDAFCVWAAAPRLGAEVMNNTPAAVTTNSATLNGRLIEANGGPTTLLVFWGLADAGTNGVWDHTTQFAGPQVPGLFSTNVSLPTPDRYYYYRYAASNAAGLFWAPSAMSFMAGGVTVEATDATAAVPGNTGIFTLSRPVTATNEALTVSYAMSGVAVNTVDYTNSASTATFAAGATQTTIVLTPLSDADTAAEEATLTIVPGTYYPVGAPSNATVTIQGAGSSYFIANNANWNVAGNWSGGFVPGAGQIGIIAGTAGSVTQANANAVLTGPPAAIIVRSNAILNATVALTEQNLVLDGGIFKSGFINHPTTISLGSNAFVQGSSHLILSGLIQDYAGNAGRLIISNTANTGYYTSLSHPNNTYSGGTEVRFGSLLLPAAAVANAAGTGDIEIYPNASIHNQSVTHPPGLRVILKGGSIYSGANYGLYAPVLVWTNSDCRAPGPNSTLFLASPLQDFDATHTGVLTVNCIPSAVFSGNNIGFSGGIKITGNTLTCTAANSLGTGPVEVEAGTLTLKTVPTCANSNDVTLHAAGTLRLETSALLGRLSGTGTNSFAILNSLNASLVRGISPGTNTTTVGTLTVDGGAVTSCRILLGTGSTNTFHLRAPGDQDQVVFTNNPVSLTLNGVLKIEMIDTLAEGDYTLFDLNGGNLSNRFSSLILPLGFGQISTNSGDVVLTFMRSTGTIYKMR